MRIHPLHLAVCPGSGLHHHLLSPAGQRCRAAAASSVGGSPPDAGPAPARLLAPVGPLDGDEQVRHRCPDRWAGAGPGDGDCPPADRPGRPDGRLAEQHLHRARCRGPRHRVTVGGGHPGGVRPVDPGGGKVVPSVSCPGARRPDLPQLDRGASARRCVSAPGWWCGDHPTAPDAGHGPRWWLVLRRPPRVRHGGPGRRHARLHRRQH